MKIYKVVGSDRTELCHPDNPEDWDRFIELIDGTPRSKTWTRVPVHLIREDMGEALLECDSPWLSSSGLVFREIVLGVLQPFGELLPLACAEADLWIFNPVAVANALDEEASSLVRFRESERVMHIDRYVFHEAVVAGLDVFKITNLRASPVFVKQRVVDLWSDGGFSGLDFEAVWSSGDHF